MTNAAENTPESLSRPHSRKYAWGVVFLVLAVGAGLFFLLKGKAGGSHTDVRYGITPYQDSALPIVAQRLGWYEREGIRFQPVPATWGDVVTALVSGSIDVAIYNFNSFQPPYENAARGERKPLFYCPLYVFKGQAIMVHDKSGYQPFHDKPGESDTARRERIALTARQLKGKRIAVTKGTELEQIVLEALKAAGLSAQDVTIIHASPEDALAAFLSGNVDAFAAGLTERVEARRHGGVELLVTADVTLPVIDGLITTREYAAKHPEVLEKLIKLWFETIRHMEQDLSKNSVYIRDYLAQAASTRYTGEEYAVAWTFNVFPKTPKEAGALFNSAQSPYHWKRAWDANNQFLLQQHKITAPIPYEAYWGETVLPRSAATSQEGP